MKKILLYTLLALLAFSLWSTWQHEHQAPQNSQPQAIAKQPPIGIAPGAATSESTHSTPTGHTGTPPVGIGSHLPQANTPTSISESRLIHVDTDLLQASIDPVGGSLVRLQLLNYPQSLKNKQPISLLNPDNQSLYVLQTGLVSAPGFTPTNTDINFTSDKSEYKLLPGKNTVDVVLTGTAKNSLKITKTYHFMRDRYLVNIKYSVVNAAKKTWTGSFYAHLKRRDIKLTHKNANRAYVGAAVSSAQTPYEKISYHKLMEQPLSRNIHGGWVAMQQHYFLTALLPEIYQTNHYYSQTADLNNPQGALYTVGFAAPQMQLKPGASTNGEVKAYMGPALPDRLNQVGEHLNLMIDYGWLSFFSNIIFKVMQMVHHVVGNWGWSIILVTLIIKLIFYPLTDKSFKSMARMKELTPEMNRLREQFAHDKQALSQATMKLYRDKKVNPLGGCLPMLIQIPVFIALYYVLIESVQLRQAPFILWIHDLSIKDPFYVLPILMGASMFLQQRLTPQAADPQQAKIMMFLPVLFTVLFLNFPAGLVLYWFTNNVLSIAQQWIVNYQMEHAKPHKKKRSRRR